jgi:hypothetical protein
MARRLISPLRVALAALGLGLGLLGYAFFFAPTEEEKILAVLDELERAVHTGPESGRNPLVRSATLRGRFGEIFEKGVTFRIAELTTGKSGREHLVEVATRATVSMTTLDVDFTRTEVALTGGGTGARVDSVADLRAFRGNERYEQGERRVTFDFSKGEGTWKISGFRVSRPDAEGHGTEDTEDGE